MSAEFDAYCKAVSNTPYQPSNGTEGIDFIMEWCAKCKRDAAFQANPDFGEGCPIVARAMLHQLGDPDYPKEWVHDAAGQPTCTAFEPIDHAEDQPS